MRAAAAAGREVFGYNRSIDGVRAARFDGFDATENIDEALERAADSKALIVLAVAQPICGVVFVLDGVLIGAGDARYLALAGVLNLVPYAPALVLIGMLQPHGAAGLAWLSVAFFGVYMLARLATLGWRVRGTAWMAIPA